MEINVCDWSTIGDGLISNNSLTWGANSEIEMAQNSHSNSQNNVDNIITRSSSIRITGSISTNDTKSTLVSSGSDTNRGVESEKIYEFRSRLEIVKSGNSSEESGNDIISGEVGWSNG